MLRIFLIRHGRTGLEGRYKGQLDVPLTPEGEKEIRRTALTLREILGETGLAAIYSSDLQRASRSASLIAGAFPGDTPVTEMPSLRERAFGLWEGLRYDEIERLYPEDFSLWVKDPLKHRPVKGESTAALRKRTEGAISSLLAGHEDGEAIAIVSHSGPIRVLLCRFLGLPLKNIFRLSVDFASLSLIELYEKSSPVARFINRGPL